MQKSTAGLLFVLAIARTAPARAASAEAGALAGVWESDRVFGPEVRGALALSRGPSGWTASIGPFTVAAREENGEISFGLPGDRGAFRGRRRGAAVEGNWIQPVSVTDGCRYATPVALAKISGDAYRGEVRPLEDRLTLDLVIRRAADGAVTAFIRNPQRNAGLRLGALAVSRSGDTVTLSPPSRPPIVGRAHDGGKWLSFAFPFADGTFDFTRRAADDAFGVVPRIPPAEGAALARPPETRDGWKTSTLAEAGLDPAPIEALVRAILARRADSVRSPSVQSLLIARHGKLALEEYFEGFSREATHDWRSASKSLTSLLAGVAIDHGAKFGPETPVYPLFPGGGALVQKKPRRARITVENLLTMTTGWACDDYDDASPGNEDTMQEQAAQPDWYRFALELPSIAEPGGPRSFYCSAAMNLAGGVIARAAGVRLEDEFHDGLAAPLGISRYHLNLMPDGAPYMAGGARLRPRDFLKFGQLILDGGTWNGRRVVSRDWIDRSVAPHASQSGKDDYGYGWHLGTLAAGGRAYRTIVAGGNGGELLVVVPELDLAVAITGGNYGDFRTWSKFEPEVVGGVVIPAIRR